MMADAPAVTVATLAEATMESFVAAAVRAPSSHNTQPWLFELGDATIDVFADRSRALPVNDPQDRELTISCGAALFNVRVAAAHAGFATAIEPLPHEHAPEFLASLWIVAGHPEQALAALHPEIERRRTYRRTFGAEPVSADVDALLAAAVRAEGASLVTVSGGARDALADLVAEGDRRQFADRRWRRELASWMHLQRRGDGLAVGAVSLPFTRLVLRSLNLGASTAARDHALARSAPLLVVLTTPNDSAADWLMAGQALQRLLLTASALGLQAGFLNQPCQVGELRHRLHRQLDMADADTAGDRGVAQLVLRLGHPDLPSKPSPRRPPSDVCR